MFELNSNIKTYFKKNSKIVVKDKIPKSNISPIIVAE